MCKREDSPEEIRRDYELKERWRDVNLDAEIAMRKAHPEPAPDPAAERVAMKFIEAQGLLGLALERGYGFADAFEAADEVLKTDPTNSGALTIRAIANSQLDNFDEAVRDAESALALDPDDVSSLRMRMRAELPFWRWRFRPGFLFSPPSR